MAGILLFGESLSAVRIASVACIVVSILDVKLSQEALMFALGVRRVPGVESAMDVKTWTTISRLLDEALDLPPGSRSDWLDRLPPEYAAFKPRLAALLTDASSMDRASFLATLPKIEIGADDASGEAVPAREGALVGPYRLVRLLASGGQGSVWLAARADGLFQREVAIKLPHGLAFRPGLAERMARERDILAALAHPNIARLYDAGVAGEGEPFLALEYVEGTPIDRHAQDRALDVATRVRLFLQVVRAVAFAHGRLVIHRDLKPSNILVTGKGEVRLLDFGIAKLLGDQAVDSTLTMEAGRAMTLAYASPEQVRHQPLGVATDVYSLGVVLFELLAGHHPYAPARDSAAALEEAILTHDPRRASDVAPAEARRTLRGDLDTILAKTLKKTPDARYRSADALAEDLQRHLDGLPVQARPDSRGYRLRKFVVRHRVAVAASAASLAAILAGAGVAVWQATVARTQRDSALLQQARAEATNDFLQSLLQQAGVGTPLTPTQLLERGARQLESATGLDDAVLSYMQYEISTHFLRFNQTDQEVALLTASADRARRTGDEDLVAAAECSAAWALANRDLAAAQARLLAGEQALARVASPSFRTHADCLRARGRVLDVDGRVGEAIAVLEQGLAVHPPMRDREWNKRSLMEVTLSDLYRRAQRESDALRVNEANLAEVRTRGRGGTFDEMTAINNVAGNLFRLGEARAASAYHEQLMAWLGQDVMPVAPVGMQGSIGFTQLRLERYDEALRLADAELHASERAGNPFQAALANLLAARALAGLGRAGEAGRRIAAAEAVWGSNSTGNARVLLEAEMARVEIQAIDDLAGATAAAAGIVSRLGFPAKTAASGLDRALRLSARLHVRSGDNDTALTHAAAALAIARRFARNERQSADVGEAALLRAQALVALGRAGEATETARLAEAALAEGLGRDHRLAHEAAVLAAGAASGRDGERPRESARE